MLTAQERARLKRIYLSKSNPSRFKGILTFKQLLEKKYGWKVSTKDLTLALRDIKFYQIYKEKKPKGLNKFRQIKLFGANLTYGSDLVIMKSFSESNTKYIGFYLFVDFWSKFALAAPAKNKSSAEFRRIFAHLFGPIGRKVPFNKLVSDFGKEYLGNKHYLLRRNVLWLPKAGGSNKPPIVERLVRTLRTSIERIVKYDKITWLRALPIALRQYNQLPHSSHGLPPKSIGVGQDPLVRARFESKKRTKGYVYQESFKTKYARMKKALKAFKQPYKSKEELLSEKPNSFKLDQPVFLDYVQTKDLSRKTMRKAFKSKRGKPVFRVHAVLPLEKQFMYILRHYDTNEILKGRYYGSSLSHAPGVSW